MKILFMGTPDFAVPSLQMLLDSTHEVVGVVTQPDKPQGRKMVLTPPPVKALALTANVTVYQPESLRNQAFLPTLQALQPDVIVVVAYGKILPSYVLDYPQHGCINVHGSLLPRWRGAAPIQWSILAGDAVTGVTTMQMDVGLDTGDMLLKYETPIQPAETAGELFDRLSVEGATLLAQTMAQLEAGTLTPVAQDDSQANYAHMLDKQMAVIDWTKSAAEIDCLVRGLNPWPIAITTCEGARMKVYRAEIVSENDASICDITKNNISSNDISGTVLQADAKAGLLVACGTDALRILELQMVGGKRMKATDYLRGHAIAAGTKLGEAE